MKIATRFVQTLQNAVGQSNMNLEVADGPRTARCRLFQCDPLGAAVTELTLETGELASADIARLQTASGSLCNRVTYLLEPISPIETDPDGCIVQMRSSPPQKDDNKRRYYELSLRRGGSVALYRYEKQPGAPRMVIPATLTHEVLGRLIEDFNVTVDEVLTS